VLAKVKENSAMNTDKKENIISYLEQQRAEKLAEMGGYLRHLRLEQSLALEEVASKTKVRESLLQAIEAGRLDLLPEPIYIRGMLQRYATALGLNGKEFASVFPTAQGFSQKKNSWRYLLNPQLKPIHLYVIYICLIIGAVTSLSHLVNPAGTSVGSGGVPSKSSVKPSPKVNSGGTSTVAIASTQEGNPKSTSSEQGVRLDMTLKDESWVRVKVDGKTEFEGTLKKGEKRSWSAKQELSIRAGNAGGVIVAQNGGEAKELGALGQPKTQTFKAN
jgi:cytoskeletal protein RodZ